MSDLIWDVAVLGAGPGGYVAAIRAAQLGMKVVLIEKEHLGGVCLNWGCIPTKALLKSAEVFSLVKKANAYGVNVRDASCDIKSMVKRSRDIVASLKQGIESLIAKNKIDVFYGKGRILSPGVLNVSLTSGESKIIKSKHIVLATGSHARTIPGFDFDGQYVWSYKNAMTSEIFPKSMIIVGGGAIVIEFDYI
jgi:dihydrolipoamide dehydrogenase